MLTHKRLWNHGNLEEQSKSQFYHVYLYKLEQASQTIVISQDNTILATAFHHHYYYLLRMYHGTGSTSPPAAHKLFVVLFLSLVSYEKTKAQRG